MRFRKIDASNLEDHARLNESDTCYYLHEYTSGQGFGFGDSNNLISNLKKPTDRKGRTEYAYKGQAIQKCSVLLKGAINADWLKFGTIIPVPPSKHNTHPSYDNRILQVCKSIDPVSPIDIREIIDQTTTIRAAHESPDNRPTVAELEAVYRVNEYLCSPVPTSIAVVDDVLTAGTHFRAMRNTLSNRFPNVPIVGMFIARRVFLTDNALDDDPF